MLLHKQKKRHNSVRLLCLLGSISPHHQMPPYGVALEALRHPLFIDAMHVHGGTVTVGLQ